MSPEDDRPELGVVPAGHAICNLCDPRRTIPLDKLIAHMRAEHERDDPAIDWPAGGAVELEPDVAHAIDCDLDDDCTCGARAAELDPPAKIVIVTPDPAAETDRRRWYGP